MKKSLSEKKMKRINFVTFIGKSIPDGLFPNDSNMDCVNSFRPNIDIYSVTKVISTSKPKKS